MQSSSDRRSRPLSFPGPSSPSTFNGCRLRAITASKHFQSFASICVFASSRRPQEAEEECGGRRRWRSAGSASAAGSSIPTCQ
eukprot:1730445-Rhodomonas_salina.2